MAGYAKDARTVLYEGARITKAHAESFEVLGIYAKDRKHLYFKRRVISGAPEKFQVFDNRYATDGNTIFCGASRLPGKKLVALGHAYAKSEIAVFHECKVLATLDPVSFNVFQNRRSYGRDHKVVILDGKPIPGADPASFEVFAPTVGHARDRRHVYYHGKVIPGADPKTIEQIDGYYFRDARAVYLEGREIVDADPKTFRLSKFDGYAVDRSRVYRIGDVVPGRDPATFE